MPQVDDKVWFSSQRKFAGICGELAASDPEHPNTLILAHFPTTLSLLESSLRTAGINFRQYSVSDTWNLCSIGERVVTGLVRSVEADRPELGNPVLRRLQVMVVEHHPIFGRDRTLLDACDRLQCKPEVSFHIALDEPLMQHFGGQDLVTLLKRLGADESESISHPLVTSAVRNAQKKIEKQTQRDLPTESIEDWFRYNLREGWS
jgi:hypothetical protein